MFHPPLLTTHHLQHLCHPPSSATHLSHWPPTTRTPESHPSSKACRPGLRSRKRRRTLSNSSFSSRTCRSHRRPFPRPRSRRAHPARRSRSLWTRSRKAAQDRSHLPSQTPRIRTRIRHGSRRVLVVSPKALGLVMDHHLQRRFTHRIRRPPRLRLSPDLNYSLPAPVRSSFFIHMHI